mgnify:CR=1 FL=1
MASHNAIDLTGQQFGRLTVTGLAGTKEYGKSGQKRTMFDCRCSCGNAISVSGNSLKSGNTKSCGCLNLDSLKGRATGYTGERVYRIWQAMLNRCRNPNQPNYANYGGRGIKVCERWLSIKNFVDDMGRPNGDQSIDRIDNDGNYEPGNCRWASREEQSRNKSSNRILTLDGKSMTLIEWAEKLGIEQSSLRERLEKWTLRKALTTPKTNRKAA